MTLDSFDREPGTIQKHKDCFIILQIQHLLKQQIQIVLNQLKDGKVVVVLSNTLRIQEKYYLYPKLIKSGIRILKFSGDVDGVVPITETFFWLNNLQNEIGLHIIQPWRAWTIPGNKSTEDQNAGNVWVLDGLWFVTIRSAEHMIPMDQLLATLVMINNFIYCIPLHR